MLVDCMVSHLSSGPGWVLPANHPSAIQGCEAHFNLRLVPNQCLRTIISQIAADVVVSLNHEVSLLVVLHISCHSTIFCLRNDKMSSSCSIFDHMTDQPPGVVYHEIMANFVCQYLLNIMRKIMNLLK